MKPILAINLKTYAESTGAPAISLARKAASINRQKKMRVIVLAQSVDLRGCAKTGAEVFAQHGDAGEPGQHTGRLLMHAIRDAGATGVMLNHAEHKLDWKMLEQTIGEAHAAKLKTMVCCDHFPEMRKLLHLRPNFIAFEIPELIGTGKSITEMEPQSVRAFTRLLGGRGGVPLCGAGVSSAADVRHALELGTRGALMASAIAHQANPALALSKLAAQIAQKK